MLGTSRGCLEQFFMVVGHSVSGQILPQGFICNFVDQQLLGVSQIYRFIVRVQLILKLSYNFSGNLHNLLAELFRQQIKQRDLVLNQKFIIFSEQISNIWKGHLVKSLQVIVLFVFDEILPAGNGVGLEVFIASVSDFVSMLIRIHLNKEIIITNDSRVAYYSNAI